MRPKLRDKRLYWRGGKIWCRVPGVNGIERKTTGCTDEPAAAARANEYERRWADPAHATSAQTTLASGVEALCADLRRRQRSKATQKKAAQKLGHYLRLWPDCTMRDLEVRGPEMVLRYIDQRLKEDVTRLTIKMELQHLDMVLRLARYRGTFHRDPKELFPPFFTAGHKPRKTRLTPEQALLLCGHLEPYRAAHVVFILATGARASEVEKARVEDVHEDRVHLRGTKTEASDDDVPITDISRTWLNLAIHKLGVFAIKRRPTEQLFEPWGNIRRDLAAACKRAGVPRVTPNDLRRTFASWHRDAGVPAELVSKLLRHTTDRLAQTTYARLGPKETGLLIAGHLRDRTNVPDLYPEGPARGSDGHERDNNPRGKTPLLPEKTPESEGAHHPDRTDDLRFTKAEAILAAGATQRAMLGLDVDCSVPELYEGGDGHGWRLEGLGRSRYRTGDRESTPGQPGRPQGMERQEHVDRAAPPGRGAAADGALRVHEDRAGDRDTLGLLSDGPAGDRLGDPAASHLAKDDARVRLPIEPTPHVTHTAGQPGKSESCAERPLLPVSLITPAWALYGRLP